MSFLPKIQRRPQYVGEAGRYGYRKYKREICDDCQHRCVYCDLHANHLGGYDVMEMDHFRPKKEGLFPERMEDPFNLLFACRSCNNKKRDDWPAGKVDETHVNGIGYVDPFDNRQEYFRVNSHGHMTSVKEPAQYMIDQLALNRPLAVAVRRRFILCKMLDEAAQRLVEEHSRLLDSAGEIDRVRLREVVELLRQIQSKTASLVLSEGAAI